MKKPVPELPLTGALALLYRHGHLPIFEVKAKVSSSCQDSVSATAAGPEIQVEPESVSETEEAAEACRSAVLLGISDYLSTFEGYPWWLNVVMDYVPGVTGEQGRSRALALHSRLLEPGVPQARIEAMINELEPGSRLAECIRARLPTESREMNLSTEASLPR